MEPFEVIVSNGQNHAHSILKKIITNCNEVDCLEKKQCVSIYFISIGSKKKKKMLCRCYLILNLQLYSYNKCTSI